jgi:hypothetical protein
VAVVPKAIKLICGIKKRERKQKTSSISLENKNGGIAKFRHRGVKLYALRNNVR